MIKGGIVLLEETHFSTMPLQVLYFTVKTTTNVRPINWPLFLTGHLGATEEPEVIPDPAKQTDRVVKIAGISAGVLVFILLVLVTILLVKKRWVEHRRQTGNAGLLALCDTMSASSTPSHAISITMTSVKAGSWLSVSLQYTRRRRKEGWEEGRHLQYCMSNTVLPGFGRELDWVSRGSRQSTVRAADLDEDP